MSDNFRDQIELLQSLVEVQEERDAAYETREENRDRWNEAKSAYAEQRSFWRGIKELTNPVEDDDDSTVASPSVSTKTKIRNEEI